MMSPPEGNGLPMATETTGLLSQSSSPSSSSGSSPILPRSYNDETLPLSSSYEDLRESVELGLKALSKKKPKPTKKRQQLQGSQAICMLIIGCALSIMLVSLVCFHRPIPPIDDMITNEEEKIHKAEAEAEGAISGQRSPLSLLDPVHDLKLLEFSRSGDTSPPDELFLKRKAKLHSAETAALPTNAWYQNMLMCRGEPTNLQRIYSIPYMVDVIGQIPGLRIHPTHVLSNDQVLQNTFNDQYGLTLGAGIDSTVMSAKQSTMVSISHRYTVAKTTELGLTMNWNVFLMTSSIVYGMPYATMVYQERKGVTYDKNTVMLPTIASRIPFGKPPIVDDNNANTISCSSNNNHLKIAAVDHELELYFAESDYSWLVVFSEPVAVRCFINDDESTFLQIVDSANDEDSSDPLVIRIALLSSCSTGRNGDNCRVGLGNRQPEEVQNAKEYASLLRQHAGIYPGENSNVEYTIDEVQQEATLVFDWDAQKISNYYRQRSHNISSLRRIESADPLDEESDVELISYALPHHLDKFNSSRLPDNNLTYCKSSIAGPTCVIKGSKWTMTENLPQVGLRAPRRLRPEFIPQISEVLQDDIGFSLPDYFMNGAGDTYFSGKMLAKLGRVLLVAEEVNVICQEPDENGDDDNHLYSEYCNNSTLVIDNQMNDAIERLRKGVEIWLNGNAEAPFVYDSSWGGVVNCGCYFDGYGCSNEAPNCPAFSDQGLNFGNGFYNDQHFHYGYHIYAAAILAHFDEDWAKQYFDKVMLLVRNIANPSKQDKYFPLFRHKDWFRGFSWASGVANPPYLNGKNQESSSEAIAAYESVAVYGQVMSEIWEKARDFDKAETSRVVLNVGQLLTATELRSAQKYWHVLQNVPSERVYPEAYKHNVIGILWSSMAQFGTWFGRAPYLPYGIQLLPLTPISEERDDLRWANEMYYPFSKACSQSFQCTDSGWVVLQLAILATVGYSQEAAQRVKILPGDAFTNAGGNGHSRSNTLWYIATRPAVDDPIPMDKSDFRGNLEQKPAPVFVLTDCHTPSTCTDEVLDRQAGEYTCRERMTWLIKAQGKSQWKACSDIAGLEFPEICGPCAPGNNPKEAEDDDSGSGQQEAIAAIDVLTCGACTLEQCDSDLNKCPVYERTFVCMKGLSVGGCSGTPWAPADRQCESCCELTNCQKLRDTESKKLTKDQNPLEPPKCPPCPQEICYGKVNQCPLHSAPFLCTSGLSHGGCSSSPWDLSSEQCTECCEITVDC